MEHTRPILLAYSLPTADRRQLPQEKALHIPLWFPEAIAVQRRAVGATLTGKARLFATDFWKICGFQQVGKNDRGKFVQNGTNCQSHKHDCPSKMATYGNFRANCHKKRAIFEKTPPLHYGVKAVGTFLDIIQKWWNKEEITFIFILILNLIVKFVLKFAIFEKTTYLCSGRKEIKQLKRKLWEQWRLTDVEPYALWQCLATHSLRACAVWEVLVATIASSMITWGVTMRPTWGEIGKPSTPI